MDNSSLPNCVAIARCKLLENGHTCVVMIEGKEYFSNARGVKPLLDLLQSDVSFNGAVASDKTVGAGAAHLYVLLGIRALWANVISIPAKRILEENGIDVFYGELVPHIINRKGDGVCPIENAVVGATTSQEAYCLILETLKNLAVL